MLHCLASCRGELQCTEVSCLEGAAHCLLLEVKEVSDAVWLRQQWTTFSRVNALHLRGHASARPMIFLLSFPSPDPPAISWLQRQRITTKHPRRIKAHPHNNPLPRDSLVLITQDRRVTWLLNSEGMGGPSPFTRFCLASCMLGRV